MDNMEPVSTGKNHKLTSEEFREISLKKGGDKATELLKKKAAATEKKKTATVIAEKKKRDKAAARAAALETKIKGNAILSELSQEVSLNLLSVALAFKKIKGLNNDDNIISQMENLNPIYGTEPYLQTQLTVATVWDGVAATYRFINSQDYKENFQTINGMLEANLLNLFSPIPSPDPNIFQRIYELFRGTCQPPQCNTCDTISYDPFLYYSQQNIGNCLFISYARLIIELIHLLYTCVTNGRILGEIQIPILNCLQIFTVSNIMIMMSLPYDKQSAFLFFITCKYYESKGSTIGITHISQLYNYIYIHFYLFMFILCYLEDSILGTSYKKPCEFTPGALCSDTDGIINRGATILDHLPIFTESTFNLFTLQLTQTIQTRLALSPTSPLKHIPPYVLDFITRLMGTLASGLDTILYTVYYWDKKHWWRNMWNNKESAIGSYQQLPDFEMYNRIFEDIVTNNIRSSLSKRMYAGISIDLKTFSIQLNNPDNNDLFQDMLPANSIRLMKDSIGLESLSRSMHALHAMFLLFYIDGSGNLIINLRNSWNECVNAITITELFLKWAIDNKIIFGIFNFTIICHETKLMGGKKRIKRSKKRSNRRIKKSKKRKIR